MNASAGSNLPRPRARGRNLPAKILLVDDDELELSLMSDRLGAVGFEVATARNGVEALAQLDKEWFPIVLADWQMPEMDGIQLVKQLRDRGNEDSYFIMLSVRAESDDFERGYGAGVDDYLSKKSPDAELLARIEAGMNTVSLRRSLRDARAALASVEDRAVEGIDTRAELLTRLRSELARARRYRRPCSLLSIAIADGAAATATDYMELTRAVRGMIRFEIDWVEALVEPEKPPRLVVVLPETGVGDIETIRRRLRSGLPQRWQPQKAQTEQPLLFIGAASFDPRSDRTALTAEELLRVGEQCGACMASDGDRHLAAVQASVVAHASIPCRQGYAVAEYCSEVLLQKSARATPPN